MLLAFRILSYILLPVALLLGMATLAGLLMALSNWSILLSVFGSGATTIYIITSFMFLQRVIEAKRTVRHSLRDWVRANAFVAMFFSSLLLVQSYMFLTNPAFVQELMAQVSTMQGVSMPAEVFTQSMKVALWLMMAVAALLLTHISLCFRLLRQYAAHFE